MISENLKTSFTKRYVIAISLIAFLSSGAFYILNLALKTSDFTALIVNKSAKQRMYSQRIASFSQQYYFNTYIKQNPSKLETIQLNLDEVINGMKQSNDALSSGNLTKDVHVNLSRTISDIYFGKENLKKRVDDYLSLAKNLTQTKTQEDATRILDQILLISNPLLIDLNEAVLQYQKEGEDNISKIRNMEILAWILTLFTLIMEVVFIFQPMATKIQDLFQKLTLNQQNLQQQIELRTLSLEQANLKLLHIASHDPLTGLKNRLNLEKELETLLVHHQEHHSPFAVVMLDIDWFKKVNDTYGHDTGDFVLCEIAKIFTENVREQDSVYRSGGEEFVVLFNRITHDQAVKKINKIRIIIQEHLFVFNDHTIRCTISGGLYYPEALKIQTVQKILKEADIALYEAKRLGRNQIVEVQKKQE